MTRTITNWLKAGAALLATVLPASLAQAFIIQNNTVYPVRYTIQSASPVTGTLSPGETVDIPFPPSSVHFTVDVETIGSGAADDFGFLGRALVQANGAVYINQTLRPINWYGFLPSFYMPYVIGTDNAGAELTREPVGADQQYRNVKFLASADCQFCQNGGCGIVDGMDTPNTVPHRVNQLMGSKVTSATGFRGAIIAGDLTTDETFDARDAYVASIAGYERHIYDGLGNHDLDGNTFDLIRPLVRNRKRATIRSDRAPGIAPHYSWDWHDVHFVQLNVLPSDRVTSDTEVQKEPFNALSFLEMDLAINVGDSGRPVVLVHHYGFDSFSMGVTGAAWWDLGQRIEYWAAIKDYNIALIITGHAHLGTSTGWNTRFKEFVRPAGYNGPNTITAFNSSAGRFGAHAEIEINERGQMRFTIKDEFDATTLGPRVKNLNFDMLIYADPISAVDNTPGIGYGWKDDPFPTIAQAIIARNLPAFPVAFGDDPVPAKRPIAFAPGIYTETEVLSGAVVIAPNAPGDIIIQGQ